MNFQELKEHLNQNRSKFAVQKRTEAIPVAPPRFIQAGLEPYVGSFDKAQAAHLLRRTTFGAHHDDIEAILETGLSESVDLLLTESQKPDPPLNNYNDDDYTDPNVPFGQTWINDNESNDEVIGRRVISLKGWFIENSIEQSISIHQKMQLFWHNHLATELWGVFWPIGFYHHLDLFWDNALGNFKELILAVTLDPVMLIYLNGYFNVKDQPDENYARELQELFCIGKGPNAGFTEDDVKAAARVLTGHSLNGAGHVFYQGSHDVDDKQFSAFYGNRVIEGRAGLAGQEELPELIDMIFDTQEVALFICRKIYRFFVYHDIDAKTETDIIIPLAQMLRDNDYEVKPVLRALFISSHFYTDENIGASIKTPLDFIVGFWRSMNVQYPASDIATKYHIHTSMLWNMSSIGMEVLDPPNVAGWPAFYQFPQFDKAWITTDTVPQRAIMTDSFVYWGFWSQSLLTNVDLLAYTASLKNPSEPDAFIDEVEGNLLSVKLTPNMRKLLKSILLSGQKADYYWTDAWLTYFNNPGNEVAKNIVETRLKFFFQRLFQLSEYHLM